ncbi:MAG: hypothetical protein AAF560_20595 [Acidobacteriota bacterium]
MAESSNPSTFRAPQRTVVHSLVCLSLVLLLLPLTHRKPGMPATLKADEPAYFLAALSLVKDGDLRCEPRDLARLYQEFPYTPVHNLILSTDDGWRTVYFGKPYIFAFLASPLAAIWGANGLVAFNSLLMVAMIWMGFLFLRRANPDWLAALFAVGFYLLSTTYRYVYWLQPELLNMFATAGCLFFGLHVFDPRSTGRAVKKSAYLLAEIGRRMTSNSAALVWSASILALGVYNKPMLAAIGLPVCFRLLRHRSWRALGIWLTSAVVSMAILAGISILFTGHPTAYLGIDRQGFNVYSPHEMPMEPEPLPEPGEEKELGRETAGWWWIFQVPQFTFAELGEDLIYFFIGRHTGLFVYQPFALLAVILFLATPGLAFGRHGPVRWVIVAALAFVALFLLLFLQHNWHGGGGFVGNRYFVMVYPAFLFLVTRIRPAWVVIPTFAVGGLLVGSLQLSPHGLVVPSPTLQAHVRNPPFKLFPYEHSLPEIPGYVGLAQEGLYISGRKDHFRVEEPEMWVSGREGNELWVQSLEPLEALWLDVRSEVPGNAMTLTMEGATATLTAGTEVQRISLAPTRPTLVRKERARVEWSRVFSIYLYRIQVDIAWGEMPRWRDTGKHFFHKGGIFTFGGARFASGTVVHPKDPVAAEALEE